MEDRRTCKTGRNEAVLDRILDKGVREQQANAELVIAL